MIGAGSCIMQVAASTMLLSVLPSNSTTPSDGLCQSTPSAEVA